MAVPIRTEPEPDCSLFSMNDGCLCLPRYSALLPYLEISQKKKVKNIVYSRYSGVPSGCREGSTGTFFCLCWPYNLARGLGSRGDRGSKVLWRSRGEGIWGGGLMSQGLEVVGDLGGGGGRGLGVFGV